MTLSFPNPARSYDDAKSRVRFLGHDGMLEIKFFVLAEVLAGGNSQRTASESDYLAWFDALRPKIQTAAKKAYSARRERSIILDLEHFR
ncbi:MAG: DUF1488 domain-containing protein [Pseudorhizobium sp.]